MLWVVGRKITVKGLLILVMTFIDKEQIFLSFSEGNYKHHGSLKASARAVLNIYDS